MLKEVRISFRKYIFFCHLTADVKFLSITCGMRDCGGYKKIVEVETKAIQNFIYLLLGTVSITLTRTECSSCSFRPVNIAA